MSFTAQHYQCCDESDDPTLELQAAILASVSAAITRVDELAAASEQKQDALLAEIAKLTKPTIG